MARAAGLLLALAASSMAAQDPHRDLGRRLDSVIRKETAAGFSGAVLVAVAGKVVLDRAYGEMGGAPLRPTSRFWIASIGKQFTAVAILRAQERGLLRLDDPISRFFPEAPADKAKTTIRHLLTHQSGLPQAYASNGIADRAAAVRAILAQPLVVPAGTRFSYSNDNYHLAAAILEIVTGRPYERHVRDELLRPIGLKDTGFAGTREARSVVPARGPLPARLRTRNWGNVGAGAMFSTTRDLYRWFVALREGRLLRNDSVAQMFKPYVAIQEGSSGLGWFLSVSPAGARRIFTRGNDDFGPNGLIYGYPDTEAVVVVLSHAGQKDGDVSFSRAAQAAIETVLSADEKR
jgi:CubicO group peptidase (beta-lactamase class C family)